MLLTLSEKRIEAQDTKSFFWKPEKKVDYLPGQHFYFTLTDLNTRDSSRPTRHFTLSSSPTEGSILRFTTRMREGSVLKNALDSLKIGSLIEGDGPTGTFIVEESEKGPHVFIAGGIGVTPFRSIIKYHIDRNLNSQLLLLYTCSTPEQITFRNELEEWANKYSNIDLVLTVSQPKKSKEKWNGLVGRLDEKLILAKTSKLTEPTFWIAGPPGMTKAMKINLQNLKINPKKIRTEEFTGY